MGSMSRDATLLLCGQGLRAAGYGFTTVVLGALLVDRGYSTLRVGTVLTALIAGTAMASLAVGALADRLGRRRCYTGLFLAIAAAGVIAAADGPFWLLLVLALTGTLSTDAVDNGPGSTLEQVMLAAEDAGTARVYGRYNAVGAGAAALGALAAALPALGERGSTVPAWSLGVLTPVGLAGALLAAWLSPAVEAPVQGGPASLEGEGYVRSGLAESRPLVRRLSGLFALDTAGSALITTGFLSYFFAQRFGASLAALGWLFFTVSLVQAASVLLAPKLTARFGLVATMVGTHLPSNLLLAAVAFAPSFDVAAGLLVARTSLSRMDVPTRQAFVMAVVTPRERTAAAAATNAARYTVRPVGPLVAGVVQQVSLGAPLLVAGVIKGSYDLALWRCARQLPLYRPGTACGARPVLLADLGHPARPGGLGRS
ncbi:MAG: hypothetical protein QOI76_971 [Frankiales bacterium]|nr:hypothetical protein [Frankiales bacterium]